MLKREAIYSIHLVGKLLLVGFNDLNRKKSFHDSDLSMPEMKSQN
jgi:hypothetical protein